MTWLPDGIGLEERELDWLRNMGDWMISKKRYYGLALPIWECTDCDGWEVIGSKEELRDRAVAGWEDFDGHSPHRPWIDARRDRVRQLRRPRAAHPRRRKPLAGRGDRRPLDAEVEHRSRLLVAVVSGRLDQRVVSRPVPQLVLRAADRVHRHDRRGACPLALRLRAPARRDRRGDAQEQGQLDPVRRGRGSHRLRRDALDVRGRQPGGQPALRVRAGARGRAPLLPAALEHVRVLRDVRPPGRLDARPVRRRRGRPHAARPMDPVAPRRPGRGDGPVPRRLRRDAGHEGDRGLR